jgi:putative endonuclease
VPGNDDPASGGMRHHAFALQLSPSGQTRPMRRTFYVYILANETRELYVGITNNLVGRVAEHRQGVEPYRTVFRRGPSRLVHVEAAGRARDAMERERQLKRWSRRRKIALIERTNPGWEDLAAAWPVR